MLFTETKGDLFTQSVLPDALAHCVSEDLRMGAGIAVTFKTKFQRVQEWKDQHRQTGQVAVLFDWSRPAIFYLITKDRYFQKPTIQDLEASLIDMKEICMKNMKVISIPRIGAGLDKLDWVDVKETLHRVVLFVNFP